MKVTKAHECCTPVAPYPDQLAQILERSPRSDRDCKIIGVVLLGYSNLDRGHAANPHSIPVALSPATALTSPHTHAVGRLSDGLTSPSTPCTSSSTTYSGIRCLPAPPASSLSLEISSPPPPPVPARKHQHPPQSHPTPDRLQAHHEGGRSHHRHVI